jgi:hypothetical protein
MDKWLGGIVFKKLIIARLVRKIPAFCGNLTFHCRVHNSQPAVFVLRQMNPVHTFQSYFSKSLFIIIFPSTCRSFEFSLQAFQPTLLYEFLVSRMCAAFPPPSSVAFLDLIIPISALFGEEYKIRTHHYTVFSRKSRYSLYSFKWGHWCSSLRLPVYSLLSITVAKCYNSI